MPIDQRVSSLATLSDNLYESQTFEVAAGHLLRAMFGAVATALCGAKEPTAQPTARQSAAGDCSPSSILRGSIHFRPDNEYQRLLCLEYHPENTHPPPMTMPSLTAWRWVTSRRCPVTIDVGSRTLRVFEGGDPRLFRDAFTSIPLDTGETCRRLVAREADYVVAFPLRCCGGVVDGMVSLELQGTEELDGRLIALAQGQSLRLLVDLAAPHLVGLPSSPSEEHPSVDEYLPVVGKTTARLVELLRVFSGLDETLLLAGPTGVGKSRLARYCHAHSARQTRPFVTLDLLACPESLQMPQLCGSKKGAYTGADRDMPGAIQRADGGTLFVDEIDKLSLPAQAGLLRLLEDRVYRPLGASGDDRQANVRFIIGTSTNLREAVQVGKFREDLYYRIAVLMVRVPPLAQRRDEIPGWAEYMLRRCHEAPRGRQPSGEVRLVSDALTTLMTQPWPGNLRQLDNVVRRAYAYALLENGNGHFPVVVSLEHVRCALRDGCDESSESEGITPLVSSMQVAARAFAEEAKRRSVTSQPLLFERADAFRAMVLDATIALCNNDRDSALETLGLGNMVRDRNHHRMIRREMDLLQRFYAALPSSTNADRGSSSCHAHEAHHLGG